ncbi:DnaB-like helicase C-terminal domain-containing protein [Nonomuraea sp. MG754425]|uniref:DnaB-like helicase C-terminal domain-containing protein n=1 Tax=Nonomuraea sp. MG754425 TaxID=2570319 RepID=UPI001F431727|nr:DnaB-like helicase C-terminal domain-containing protein [Nonomuraea sp. MG754425]
MTDCTPTFEGGALYDPREDAIPLADLVRSATDTIGTRRADGSGVPFGFEELDALLGGGLAPGTLTVVASRPSMGTSTLLMDLCRNAAIRHRTPTMLAGYQSPHHELILRLVSAETRVPLDRLRAGTLDDDEWARVTRRMTEAAGAPLFIVTPTDWTVVDLSARAADLAAVEDVRLMVVDGLHDIRSTRPGEPGDRLVTEAARALKELAMQLEMPVVVGAQLNRNPECRIDRRPGPLTDLRYSDAVGHIADLVVMVHREDAYDPDSTRAGEADLIVAKHRDGPRATVTVSVEPRFARFVDPRVPLLH